MIILSQHESVFHNPARLLTMSPVLMAFPACSSQQRKMKSEKSSLNSVIFLIFLPGNLYNTEFQENWVSQRFNILKLRSFGDWQ